MVRVRVRSVEIDYLLCKCKPSTLSQITKKNKSRILKNVNNENFFHTAERILLLSQQLLKVFNVCSHSRAKTVKPLVNNSTACQWHCDSCRAEHAKNTSIHQCRVHPQTDTLALLDDASCLVVDRIVVGAVGWPQIWWDESMCCVLVKLL